MHRILSELSTSKSAIRDFEEISHSVTVRAVALKQLTMLQNPPINELLECGQNENMKLAVVSNCLSCFTLGLRLNNFFNFFIRF